MTLEEVWAQLIEKNGRLTDPEAEIVFKSKNLKHLLQQVWNQGEKHQKNLEKSIGNFSKKEENLRSIINKAGLGDVCDDLFGDMFKGMRP